MTKFLFTILASLSILTVSFSQDVKENKVDNKSNTLFPSFESDERDENVPKLCNSDQSVSDDSIGDVINIKF